MMWFIVYILSTIAALSVVDWELFGTGDYFSKRKVILLCFTPVVNSFIAAMSLFV